MLLRAIRDAALAVLDHRVLLGHAAHAGEADVLLVDAVDQVFVGAVADRNEVRIHLRDHAVAFLELRDLLLAERAIRIPRIGVDPAVLVVDRHPGVAEVGLAGQRGGRGAVRGQRELRAAPVAHAIVGAARATHDEADLVLEDREQRQRILADPAQALLVGRRIGVRVRGHARCRHVQEREVRGVERALDRLRPIAFLQLLGDVAVRLRQGRELELRQLGQFALPGIGSHVGPDHAAVLARRVGLEPQRLVVARAGRHVGQLHRAPLQVELPAMEHAADRAVLVASEVQVRAAVRAARVDQSDHALAVAEDHQPLAHDVHAHRRAVALRQFARQRHGLPEAAKELAHRCLGPGAGEHVVVGGAEHRGRLLVGGVVQCAAAAVRGSRMP